MAKVPNVLLIMADQLAPQALPVYGHPLVKAPNIEGLAERGVVFENAYCNFPLCVPSRMSMLTGRLANAIGVWDNASELPASVPIMPYYLRALGYSASLCGKMHFIGPDQLHGFEERLTTDIYPSNFAWTPNWTEGDRPTGLSMRPVVEAGTCVRSMQIDYDDEVEYFAVQKIYDLARYADDRPFFFTVSFTHPHPPFVITERYWDFYRHENIDMPAVPPILDKELDPFSRWLHYAHGGDLHTVTDAHVRDARHAYYGMVSYIDDKVGRILATLAETGLADDTVVIFTGDHGEMLGERGMWYKQTFFEWSSRVPLVVSHPRAFAPRRTERLVSLVDLLPTLVDLGADGKPPEPPSPLDGRSLVPLLKGHEDGWDDTVISEYTGEGTCAPCRMIRRGRYKYVYTHGYPGQLFDLENDPNELVDLAGGAAVRDVEETLRADVLGDWDPEDVARRARASQRARRFIQDVTGGEPTWAFKVRDDDDRRFVRKAGGVSTKGRARFPFVEPTPFERPLE